MNYINLGKVYKQNPHQNLHTNPIFSVPILGRLVLDPLRCRAPLASLLHNKLGHSTSPRLGLSFSPLPAGELVSRESQKTKEFGVGRDELLGVRASN